MTRTRPLLALVASLAVLCGACSRAAPPAAAAAPAPVATAPAPTPKTIADELLAADRQYAARAAGMDAVAALSAMFASDVQLMVSRFEASGATAATELLRGDPKNTDARVTWAPVGAGVSADGRHGYTFGYMTQTMADSTTEGFKYLAYWTKGDDWRVVVYRRSRRAAGEVSTAMLRTALPAAFATGNPAQHDAHARSLAAAEQAFSDEAQTIGLGPAFAKYGSPEAINLGGATASIVVGPEAIARLVSEGGPPTGSPVVWNADRTIVAGTGDLGVTIGRLRVQPPPTDPAQPAEIPFFTIWRRADLSLPWRYVAE